MDVVKVAHLDELADSRPRRYDVEGTPVFIVKIDGTPHALVDICPHNGAALSDGVVRDGCVTCPSHLWRFSIMTGHKQQDEAVAVRVLATRVTADNWVEVEVPPPADSRSMRQVLLDHARGAADSPGT